MLITMMDPRWESKRRMANERLVEGWSGELVEMLLRWCVIRKDIRTLPIKSFWLTAKINERAMNAGDMASCKKCRNFVGILHAECAVKCKMMRRKNFYAIWFLFVHHFSFWKLKRILREIDQQSHWISKENCL